MCDHKVKSFCINYKEMNKLHFDYCKLKIMKELEWIKRGFICERWWKADKDGTRGKFVNVSEDELLKRCGELMQKIKDS